MVKRSRMAAGVQNQEGLPQDLRKQLALAARSIQWSYAIFWSLSVRQPGVLEWGDGYYNGDIKTRKMVQATEVDTDQLGLKRSDQLRELYESLSLGETSPQSKRPTVALSPEDLTDAEWYFLVCMSFVFNPDQGLPGRAFAKNQAIWLCNAHRADTKVFSRSLLAKSASIQTILCFPHLGGVIELGSTELVPEDLSLIQHVKRSFLDCSSTTIYKTPNLVSGNITNNDDTMHAPENGHDRLLDYQDRDIATPNNFSDDFADNVLRDESNLGEDAGGEASQMQSWRFIDDAISSLNNSMTSSDCVSQTHVDSDRIVPSSGGTTKETNDNPHKNQECRHQQVTSGFLGNENENHYHGVLTNLLKNSHQLILGPYFRNGSMASSFVSWRRDGLLRTRVPQRPQQILLKKVLFEVAKLHESHRLGSGINTSNQEPEEDDEFDKSNILSERKCREKINERFTTLGSLVPSGGKVDKISLLDHTIEYLKELQTKVGELESYKGTGGLDSTMQNKHQDAIERTSDNYGHNTDDSKLKQPSNKRKAYETHKIVAKHNKIRPRDTSTEAIDVNVAGNTVSIDMRCPLKEHLLLELMEAVGKLHMDTQSVQSSNTDGILSVSIKAKCKELKGASPSVIRQTLLGVVKKN